MIEDRICLKATEENWTYPYIYSPLYITDGKMIIIVMGYNLFLSVILSLHFNCTSIHMGYINGILV